MTKYVQCRVIEPEGFEKPTKPPTPGVCVIGVSESGPINIKKHFIGKYQTRKEWYLPTSRFDMLV